MVKPSLGVNDLQENDLRSILLSEIHGLKAAILQIVPTKFS